MRTFVPSGLSMVSPHTPSRVYKRSRAPLNVNLSTVVSRYSGIFPPSNAPQFGVGLTASLPPSLARLLSRWSSGCDLPISLLVDNQSGRSEDLVGHDVSNVFHLPQRGGGRQLRHGLFRLSVEASAVGTAGPENYDFDTHRNLSFMT